MTGRSLAYSIFLAWGLVPTYFAAVGLASGPVRAFEVAMAAFALAWWAVAVALRSDVRGATWLALALVAEPWALGIFQMLHRLEFVVRYRGFELPNGDGSPLAFLLGFFTELLFIVVPLTVLAILLWRSTRSGGSRMSRPAI